MIVEVYRNLHKKCFSIRHKGKVIDYVKDDEELHLTDVTFRVQPAGCARVRREKRKNVHAYVRGIISPRSYPQVKDHKVINMCNEVVTYNPYTMVSFQGSLDGTPIYEAHHAIFRKGKLYVSRDRRLK